MHMEHPEQAVLMAIGRLEGKVDSLLSQQKQFEAKFDHHDKRIRDLEHHRAWSLGVAAAVGSGISLILSYVFHKTH